MTSTSTTQERRDQTTDKTALRPFRVNVPEAELTELRRRINATQVMMAAHPQTLYGLADSPVALAAWMIDHDPASYGQITKLFVDGEPYGDLTRDAILDNITLSWLTNTGVSSARLYVEYKGAFFNDFNISVPAAVSVFAEEVYKLRGVGPSALTTISSISTPSPKAGTLPPGNSRSSSQKRYALASGRCADSQ
jgi:hypothetical protein